VARRSSVQSTMSLADVAAAAAMDAGVAPKGQFPNGDGASGGVSGASPRHAMMLSALSHASIPRIKVEGVTWACHTIQQK